MRNGDYNCIIKEYFDISDRETRKILLNINEADQNTVLLSLTSKLYDNIINKVDHIDFGNIPNTKGDITKIEKYNEMNDCICLIHDLLKQYNQDTKPADIVLQAIENIKKRKDLFQRGFRYNVELPIVVYSTITLSIVSAISFLISTSIEFIKEPNQDTFQITLDKVGLYRSKDSLLFKNLDRFNRSCANKQLDNSLDYAIKKNIKNFTGLEPGIILAGTAIAGLILNIIPIMRELIFFFYYSRVKVSDYLEMQSELLQMNVYNIQNNETLDKIKKEKIISKQSKIINILKNITNKLYVNYNKAEKNAVSDITNDNKKYKTSELLDCVPDSASSSIF